MHGAGNDYVVLDARDQNHDWAELARKMCDRHYGVGADGLLLVVPSAMADIRMRMFNPDGSEAEMCGNGIRCFAKYVVERSIVAKQGALPMSIKVETSYGVLDVTPIASNGKVHRARVSMGEPRFRAEDIPVAIPKGQKEFRLDSKTLAIKTVPMESLVAGYPITVDGRTFAITCVSMGNPHAVAFIDQPVDTIPLEAIGPKVEHHPIFPRRVNFHIVNVLSKDRLKARTWERGAGITLACGTGACAIQAVARLLGLTDATVQLQMPGGVLTITWPGHGPVIMEGPVEEVFEGEWRG
jgi:diaminopimelate epimerase